MERDLIRLECIKLAVSATRNHDDSLARAKEYFDFVNEADPGQREQAAITPDPAGAAVTVGKVRQPTR